MESTDCCTPTKNWDLIQSRCNQSSSNNNAVTFFSDMQVWNAWQCNQVINVHCRQWKHQNTLTSPHSVSGSRCFSWVSSFFLPVYFPPLWLSIHSEESFEINRNAYTFIFISSAWAIIKSFPSYFSKSHRNKRKYAEALRLWMTMTKEIDFCRSEHLW